MVIVVIPVMGGGGGEKYPRCPVCGRYSLSLWRITPHRRWYGKKCRGGAEW